jgi:NRPS condensation-like uncharacterized protein
MDTPSMTLRTLGTFEHALFLSDQHAPFNVVTVLRLESPPAPEIIERALQILQKRHPLLRAVIKEGKFERRADTSFSFKVIEQTDFKWLDGVEQEMNSRLIPERELCRGMYIVDNTNYAHLILTFHHTIMDAASGMNLLHELLQICNSLQDDQELPRHTLEVVSPVEKRFPASFRGLRGAAKMMRYALAQMAQEMQYQARVRGERIAPVHLGGRGFPLTLTMPESLVDPLSKCCRMERVTLNSLLNATLLLATNRHLYAGELHAMQTFTFADLRPYTVPPTSAEHLANYISMMRFTMEVSGQSNIWELTKNLHVKIYRALQRGDKFLATKMSESLIKMFVTMQSMRMGATALNYSGAVPLETHYGEIQVKGLHAFLSSFDLGPEVSSQARLFGNEICMDFMFLETDMDRTTAEKIVGEVKSILKEAITSCARA